MKNSNAPADFAAELSENSEAGGLLSTVRLSQKEFEIIGGFIHKEIGIRMPPAKKTMLEARLQKRLRILGLTSFKEYMTYLFNPEVMSSEIIQLFDVVTTNKTNFFREPNHFEFLVRKALPDLLEHHKYDRDPIKIWSAGCSTGEEPYTLAMVLNEYAQNHHNFRFKILATDISTRVLQTAVRGIYDLPSLCSIPPLMKNKYFMRNRDPKKKLMRVIPELRSIINFKRLNFMSEGFEIETNNIIFCRNVLIYFEPDIQTKVLLQFHKHLKEGGYLFIGGSETLNGLNLPFTQVAPTIYMK